MWVYGAMLPVYVHVLHKENTMNPVFNRGGFEVSFNKIIKALEKSEKLTKDTLRDVSRSVLEAHHATEHIGYINQLLSVLTPKNREMLTLFFKEFSGFKYESDTKTFKEKNKKKYDAAHAASMEALTDPHFNVWSWAEKNIKEMEVKPKAQLLDIVQERVESWVERAKKEKISEVDLLRAFFKGGVHPSTILELMDQAGYELGGINPVELDKDVLNAAAPVPESAPF